MPRGRSPSRSSDVFDLDAALDRVPGLDLDGVIRCFQAYMDFGGTPVSRAVFEQNLAAKRIDGTFLTDVQPLLSVASATWDGQAALDRVLRELVARLPGEPWAGDTP